MNLNRTQTAIYRITDHRNDDYVPGTPEDRIGLVWPLTREIASLSKKHAAERRLQRHITLDPGFRRGNGVGREIPLS
jgi:hypothetical protein